MIAYIDLPLRGAYTVTGHEVLVVALYVPAEQIGQVSATRTPRVIYVDQDGSMGEAEIGEININWRYDDNRRKWRDVDTGEELETEDGEG